MELSDDDIRAYNIEQTFILSLKKVNKFSIEELIIRIKNIYLLCKQINDYSHISYAFLDLYYSQLKLLNHNIIDTIKIPMDRLITIVREKNVYSKIVGILFITNIG
jgi:hypothetical protein